MGGKVWVDWEVCGVEGTGKRVSRTSTSTSASATVGVSVNMVIYLE